MTAKDNYGYEIKIIDDISEIINGDYHYVYKDNDFLFKKKNNDFLLVTFHGGINNNMSVPVFRMYNHSLKSIDILCMADYLLKKYNSEKLLLSWFLSSKKYDTNKIYQEIIGYIIQKYKYKKILFTGTSGGGFASLYYSFKFNAHCLIGNAQIYIEKYYYFSHLVNILKKHTDEPILVPVGKLLELGTFPKQIVISINKLDTRHSAEAMDFIKFIKEKGYNNIIVMSFSKSEPGKSVHNIQYNQSVINIITNIFNNTITSISEN